MSIRPESGRTTTRRKVADPDHAIVRGVGRRLAVLTVGSLVALVVVMLAIVFFTTRAAFEQSLHDTLTTLADTDVRQLVESTHPGDERTERIQETADSELTLRGVFLIVTDTNLHVLGGVTKIFGGKLADVETAREVLAQHDSRFSKRESLSHDRYLIYTVPLLDDTKTLGVAQLGVSMRQYDESVNTVLHDLLIASALGLAASAAITLIVVGRALTPIRRSLGRQRDFVADAAHELRTPVAILHTAAELGLESGDAVEQQSALEQALAESVHLARLVDDLSLLAHADSGVMSLEHEPMDLAALVRDAVSGIELLAEERGVRLTAEAPDTMPFVGDWVRLRQVTLILLDNALKHTPPEGAIAVRLARQGSRITLQVEDSGPGIDPKDIPQLFDRFYRGARERGVEGGGLGLAIGRWIAQAHGGQIRAANVLPHGAVFTVVLPAS